MATPREKFQALLKKLFQFDNAELDFGIYRIMNHKRAVIERFIEKDLIKGLDKALVLDSCVVSFTPYDDLRRHHGAEWNRAKYAEAHVFFGDEPQYGHIQAIVTGPA